MTFLQPFPTCLLARTVVPTWVRGVATVGIKLPALRIIVAKDKERSEQGQRVNSNNRHALPPRSQRAEAEIYKNEPKRGAMVYFYQGEVASRPKRSNNSFPGVKKK
ncbi:predicted protein [Uncinocarpus reesii 1704]|uniref:Uncharacterized protein n=1 Tax=Uncinocarpus reesii (strain UAMH 1704) TaxID=336963 RepID=C4JU73_UNCRE|nr:uncharacterized protein UREG_06012 [Uncinocarpus reesii 1704]EEP81170.1 predicted protein [Uncinocarpus reesii 1704]